MLPRLRVEEAFPAVVEGLSPAAGGDRLRRRLARLSDAGQAGTPGPVDECPPGASDPVEAPAMVLVDGRTVAVACTGQDAGTGWDRRGARTVAWAADAGLPVVVLHGGSATGGVRDGTAPAGEAATELLAAQARAAGRVPLLAVVLGPVVGRDALAVVQADVVVAVHDAAIVLDGPDRVRAVTGEEVDLHSLGGAVTHAERTGLVHLLADDEAAALTLAKELVAVLARTAAPVPAAGPVRPAVHPPDARAVVRSVLDGGRFLELMPGFAPNLVVGLGRVEGRPLAVLATQPRWLAGAVDHDAAGKGARAVELCDRLGLSLLVVTASQGTVPGTSQEQRGATLAGARLLTALARLRAPRVELVIGDVSDTAAALLLTREAPAPPVLAWPGARLPAGAGRSLLRIAPQESRAAVTAALGAPRPVEAARGGR